MIDQPTAMSDLTPLLQEVLDLQNVDAEQRTLGRLLESEARLQAAVDLVKLGLYSWDPQSNDLVWDARVKAMWGLPPEAHIDYTLWRDAVHAEDVDRIEAAVVRSTDPSGDGLFDVEYRVIGIHDGVERWVATRGRTNFVNGRAASFYGVAIDVTDQKHVEADLERRVEARTRELESLNRQLRLQVEQRRLAEAAVEQLQRLDAIGQITSGVAHDFNNLLTVVLTNARLLTRKNLEADDREGIELIVGAAERGAKLTAQLLAFSREQRLEPQAVALNDRINSMIGLLGVGLGDMIRLETDLDPDLWDASVDPTQIELIVLNLALNARDAMQSGGTLTIRTFNEVVGNEPRSLAEPPPGAHVVLAVGDTGVGISDAVLPRVFEPFFTTKERGKGSGLGLAQVFGVAKQSGGGVRVDTRLGVGTSVSVYLPCVLTSERGINNARANIRKPLATEYQAKVLVVDDDGTVLKSALRMLVVMGYWAIPANSGAEALVALREHPDIALVLADYAMPEIDGVKLAQAIRTARPTVPVVVVSGNANREALAGLGESLVLHKPYTEGELADAIELSLARAR